MSSSGQETLEKLAVSRFDCVGKIRNHCTLFIPPLVPKTGPPAIISIGVLEKMREKKNLCLF